MEDNDKRIPCEYCQKLFLKEYPWSKYCSPGCRYIKGYEIRKKKGRRDEILKKFNITSKEYDILFEEQKGRCAICRNYETAKSSKRDRVKKLAVDHCHKTEIIRGLLCMRCNKGLGQFKDNPMYLVNAAEYVKQKMEEK